MTEPNLTFQLEQAVAHVKRLQDMSKYYCKMLIDYRKRICELLGCDEMLPSAECPDHGIAVMIQKMKEDL